jgi:hypothetical protein
MLKPFKSMPGEDITKETTLNNNNIAYNKNNYCNKNRTNLTLTKYIYSP